MGDEQDKGKPERRHHRMYVTKNSEYHLRDDVVVGVRKRDSGIWDRASKALRARLVGAFNTVEDVLHGIATPPRIGEPLLFINEEGEDIITTKVSEIARPPREARTNYLPPLPVYLDDEISSTSS
jgi:hypothetical protein